MKMETFQSIADSIGGPSFEFDPDRNTMTAEIPAGGSVAILRFNLNGTKRGPGALRGRGTIELVDVEEHYGPRLTPAEIAAILERPGVNKNRLAIAINERFGTKYTIPDVNRWLQARRPVPHHVSAFLRTL